MEFSDCLNSYIKKIGCTSKELAEASSISNASISRYRKGERVPAKNSDVIKTLAVSLEKLARRKNIENISSEQIVDEFRSCVKEYDFSKTAGRFDLLVDSLNMNASELAAALNYDPSYISRVRANKRQPYDAIAFVGKVVNYTIEHYKSEEDLKKIASLLRIEPKELSDNASYQKLLNEWLLTDSMAPASLHVDPSSFLNKMDDFNLDEFTEAIHFNDIKIPTVPFQVNTRKSYFGIKEMREGELDFFKSTVLSKSKKPVTICNDMPMEDMSKDEEFLKKWMFGIAVILKKGLQINMIHTLNRPFDELMLGLEGWIPLYMTGLVKPYYFKDPGNSIYGHLHYASGEAAMYGECIAGHHDKGHYYLTRKKDEVAMYNDYCNFLLEKALPLMEIYTMEENYEFAEFLATTVNCPKGILHRYTSLPIYTLDEQTLINIMSKSGIKEEEQHYLLIYYNAIKKAMEKVLETSTITDEIVDITRENFEEKKPYILLTESFCTKQIYYTYEEYEYHLKRTEEFAKEHPNYTLIKSDANPFKNIQITIVRGKWALLSKSNHPNIHFVIKHPVLRDAIENMTVALKD